MQAEIISIGTELLLGEIADTNAMYIAQKLREIGLDLIFMTTVGDNTSRIASVIDHALDRADVVITSGGLGPTVDDVTRDGIAQATGRPLVFHQELLDEIAERFKRFGVRMSDNNRRQAHVPQGAQPISNPVGTAPIFILETERGVVMTLPGVPREMKFLLDNRLIPWLRDHLDSPAVIVCRVLRTAGIGESQIDMRIGDLMTTNNPTVALAAHTGQTDIRITAKAPTREQAAMLLDPLELELRTRLGSWIYGTDKETIDEIVTAMLKQRGASVACVEIGTDGLLGQRLDGLSAPEVFTQILALSQVSDLPEARIQPEDSITAAAEKSAAAIGSRYQATYGLALFVQADEMPDDQASINAAMAVASQDKRLSRSFAWTQARTDAPTWASTHALAMLRRLILLESG
jgi:nicotinamide-nucleotide amidase